MVCHVTYFPESKPSQLPAAVLDEDQLAIVYKAADAELAANLGILATWINVFGGGAQRQAVLGDFILGSDVIG